MSKHPSYAVSVLGAVLTSPATLAKLAARGMFASVPLSMPQDIHTADIKILFEGEVSERSIIEVYAPGDETGWAVVYKPGVDGAHTGETELIWGQWLLVRGKVDFSREESKAAREAGELAMVDEPHKFQLTDQRDEKARADDKGCVGYGIDVGDDEPLLPGLEMSLEDEVEVWVPVDPDTGETIEAP